MSAGEMYIIIIIIGLKSERLRRKDICNVISGSSHFRRQAMCRYCYCKLGEAVELCYC